MALNWTMLKPDRTPVPLPHEQIITTIDSGADLALTIPDRPIVDAQGSGGSKRLQATGNIWLTDQRLIYVTSPASDPGPPFKSLSVPLHSVLSTKFEQPLFGENYLSFGISPSPDGGLSEGTSAELRLKDRAMFQFVSLLEKARERAIYMKRQSVLDDESLPGYSSEAGSSITLARGSSTPADNPPGYSAA